MAEHSYFWPDVNGDREYKDDDFAEYAGGFATHGVYDGNLAVTAGGNMSIVIPSGRAYVGPAWKVRKYYNDSPLTLTIANADGVLNRKDTVVLRSDINTRSVTAQVLTGTPASNPVAPAIVRTAEQYDLKIAEISVPAGTTAITQALITDTRLDSTVCGIVTGVMQQVDTTTLYNQIQADLASFKSVNEADFTAWVASIKDILDAETAGNLLNLINNHKGDYPSHITQLTCTKTGTVYALTGLTATAGIVSCMFKVDAAYVAGNTVTVNGTAYTLKTIDGTVLTVGAWAQGALVHGIVDVDSKVLYVAPSAPVGAIPATASCNKNWNWSGQSGQPSWLWGGNDPSNMYVYNPSNFNVNGATYSTHAVGSGGAALRNNTATVGGSPSGGSDGDGWDICT